MPSPLTARPRVDITSKPVDADARVPPAVAEEWVRRLKAGDAKAFEAIFHAYYSRLCRFAERWLHSPEAAEEATCDVFSRVWEQRAVLEIRSSLAGYLYAAVRNRALRQVRHEKVVQRERERFISEASSPGMGQPVASPDEEMDARRLAEAVEQTLEELPPRAREAFVLQRTHALSYAEVGEAMGISVSTVEKHMIRGISLLRRRLEAWR